jgi:AraC-like DNA-binding protein
MQALLHYMPPGPALRGWVRQHQFVRLRFAPGTAVPVKPYWPRPAAALAFYPRDRERIGAGREAPSVFKPRSVLIGQPTLLTQRQLGADSSVYQIEFEPGALYRLLGVPLDRFTDGWIDAESLMPPGFRALADQIEDQDDPLAQRDAAERFLAAWVARCQRPVRPADRVAAAVLEAGQHDLDALARRCGISLRQLLRQSSERQGVGPKLLARIARFDRLVRAADRAEAPSLLQLAVHAGYHDHRHLARDFRQFTLATPSEFLAWERAAPERQFGLSEPAQATGVFAAPG